MEALSRRSTNFASSSSSPAKPSMSSSKRRLVIVLPPMLTVPSRSSKRNTSHGNEVYRKILRTSYKDHVTNEEVRAKIQQAIEPYEDLLTIVKRRKLQWYGHVSRSSGLPKTILQGRVKGGRRQGRQRKRWEDKIREWTGLEFAKSRGQWRTEINGGNWS